MGRGPAAYGVAHEAAIAAEAKRVTAWIDAHLFEELSVARIADANGLSAFHFSRRFSRRQGESVMAFVRGRRLEAAARRLANGGEVIAGLGLECGFASQAAFTRAFTRAFGLPPGDVLRSTVVPVRKRRDKMTPAPNLTESIQRRDAFRVAGLTGFFAPQTFVDIAAMWQRAVPQFGFSGNLGGKETLGLFRGRDLSARSFEHMAGVRTADDAELPEGFDAWLLPAGDWLVYRQELNFEPLHLQMMAAETEIRTERVPRSGASLASGPDFQLYPADFRLGPGGWLEHWLPIA